MVEFEKLTQTIALSLIYLGLWVVIFAAALAFTRKVVHKILHIFHLKKYIENPVISPALGSGWDDVGTFNPAAYMDDNGNVHLIYRAMGWDGMSRFGYATSSDGKDFSDKSPYPVFAMENPRQIGIAKKNQTELKYDPVMYPSGGSWGGSEDPRMTRIGDKIYVTFSAFDGWDFIRMAVISIKESDFINKKWKWSKPILISPAGEINKNWVLFPGKINGKFAVLHSINPTVQVDYVDSLEELSSGAKKIKSRFGQSGPRDSWDTYLRGVGPSPIRTDKGWLVLYHATTAGEGKYKLGAMLLDLDNPEKVIARSPEPILAPDEWYENDWKAGVIYACGAVVKDGNLIVYYGGGDKHVCIAERPLDELLNWLFEHGQQ